MHWTTLSDTEIFTWPAPSEHVWPIREEIALDDVRLVVLRQADGTSVIERVISPRPSDYLNPNWQPGKPYRG